MTFDDAARQLALVLRAENDHLAKGEADAAAQLLPQKEAAAAALKQAGPGALIDARVATTLRDLAEENRTRLAQAIEVQGKILEMVARAARQAVVWVARDGAVGGWSNGLGAAGLAPVPVDSERRQPACNGVKHRPAACVEFQVLMHDDL